MMEGGVFTLNLEGEVPPELTKEGKPSKKKSRVRPSWSKITMKKNSTEKNIKIAFGDPQSLFCSLHRP